MGVGHALDNEVNEQIVFHGTSPEAIEHIALNNFKLGKAGKNAGCMFGPGIYVAQHASKSDEYSKRGPSIFDNSYGMLICRAAVGHTLAVTEPADYSSVVKSGGFDSVF